MYHLDEQQMLWETATFQMLTFCNPAGHTDKETWANSDSRRVIVMEESAEGQVFPRCVLPDTPLTVSSSRRLTGCHSESSGKQENNHCGHCLWGRLDRMSKTDTCTVHLQKSNRNTVTEQQKYMSSRFSIESSCVYVIYVLCQYSGVAFLSLEIPHLQLEHFSKNFLSPH